MNLTAKVRGNVYEAFREHAEAEGKTISEIIGGLIRDYLASTNDFQDEDLTDDLDSDSDSKGSRERAFDDRDFVRRARAASKTGMSKADWKKLLDILSVDQKDWDDLIAFIHERELYVDVDKYKAKGFLENDNVSGLREEIKKRLALSNGIVH